MLLQSQDNCIGIIVLSAGRMEKQKFLGLLRGSIEIDAKLEKRPIENTVFQIYRCSNSFFVFQTLKHIVGN